MHKLSPFWISFAAVFLLSSLWAISSIVSVINGGNPLDGIAGGQTNNTPFQDDLFRISSYLFFYGIPFCIVVGIIIAVIGYKKDKRMLWLPLVPLITPALAISYLIIGIA